MPDDADLTIKTLFIIRSLLGVVRVGLSQLPSEKVICERRRTLKLKEKNLI